MLHILSLLYCCFVLIDSRPTPAAPIIATYWPAYGISASPDFSASKLQYYFVTVTSEDGFSIPAGQELPTELVSKSHLNNDRVLFSLGGVTGSRYFSELCFTAASRAKFIDQIISFTSLWNFDGIDMDWELPGKAAADGNIVNSSDSANLLLFLQSLRARTDRNVFTITAAVSVFGFAGPDGSPLSDLSPFALFDFINLMVYDITGSFSSQTGPVAPTLTCGSDSSVTAAVDFWISRGFPADQILLGIPSYAVSFTTASSTLATTQVGQFSTKFYQKIVSPIRAACPQVGCNLESLLATGILSADQSSGQAGFIRTLDACTQAPYLFNPSTREFISYEDNESISRKADFARTHGLAGVMIFDANGFSLSSYDVIQNSLAGNSGAIAAPPAPVPVRTTPSASPASTQVSISPSTSTSTNTYTIKAGDTCTAIGNRFNFNFYSLNPAESPSCADLEIGQLVNIPGSPAPAVTSVTASASTSSSSVSSIIPTSSSTVTSLAIDSTTSSTDSTSTVLVPTTSATDSASISATSSVQSSLTASASASAQTLPVTNTYTIKSGDTCTAIGNRFNFDFFSLNSAEEPSCIDLQIGALVNIPASAVRSSISVTTSSPASSSSISSSIIPTSISTVTSLAIDSTTSARDSTSTVSVPTTSATDSASVSATSSVQSSLTASASASAQTLPATNTYTIKSGDTCTAIGNRFNFDFFSLNTAESPSCIDLQIGALVNIPASAVRSSVSVTASSPTSSSSTSSIIPTSSSTVTSIASDSTTSSTDSTSAVSVPTTSATDSASVPATSSVQSSLTASASASAQTLPATNTYTIKSGDTCTAIGNRFNFDFFSLNSAEEPSCVDLQIGALVNIPGSAPSPSTILQSSTQTSQSSSSTAFSSSLAATSTTTTVNQNSMFIETNTASSEYTTIVSLPAFNPIITASSTIISTASPSIIASSPIDNSATPSLTTSSLPSPSPISSALAKLIPGFQCISKQTFIICSVFGLDCGPIQEMSDGTGCELDNSIGYFAGRIRV